MKGFTLTILLMACSVAHAVEFGTYNQIALGKLDGSLSINGLEQYGGLLQVELIAPDDRPIDFELTRLNEDAVRVNISDPNRYSHDTHLAVNVYLGTEHFANFIVIRGDDSIAQGNDTQNSSLFARRPRAKNLQLLNLDNEIITAPFSNPESQPDQISAVDDIAGVSSQVETQNEDVGISLDPDKEKLTASLDNDSNASPILTSMSISTDVIAPESSPYITAETNALPARSGVSAQTVIAASATTIAAAVNTLAPLGYALLRYPGDEDILNTDISDEFLQSGSLADLYRLTGGRVACIAINHKTQTVRVIPADKHDEVNRDPTATVGALVASLNARNNYAMVTLPGDLRIHNIATSATAIDAYEDLHDIAADNDFMILIDNKNRTVRLMGTL